MLKIKKIYSGYLKDFYIGRYVKFIELDEYGYESKIEDVVNLAVQNKYVVIKAKDVFKYKEISQVCKHINKLNPDTKIIIYTNGMTKSVGMNAIKDVEYIIYSKLKNSGISYHNRINDSAYNWFANADSNFIFDVYNENDIDEIKELLVLLSIKKHQVNVNIKSNDFDDIASQCKALGYNIYIKLENELCDE